MIKFTLTRKTWLLIFNFFRTITNVEEHIKNAFISETALSDSSFRHLKIDYDSIEIKRQLDPEILRQAAYSQDQVSCVTGF